MSELRNYLLRPSTAMTALSAHSLVVRRMIPAWSVFFLIAIFGSLLYGASMSLVFPGLALGAGALLILLSAGLGWFVFGPLLLLVSKRPPLLCAHACMVTMVYGEAVLALGALGNLLLWASGLTLYLATPWNSLALLTGNLTMAVVLASQLRVLGVPLRRTLLVWVLGLNGSGTLFFWFFSRVL
jgi:hypothetical protein